MLLLLLLSLLLLLFLVRSAVAWRVSHSRKRWIHEAWRREWDEIRIVQIEEVLSMIGEMGSERKKEREKEIDRQRDK